ncbi:MAG TPA: CRTAC1 family protein, partial [Gemmataceae bacterium]|nr:CRTAC1 family protein [Gemmataceae bacterium]
GRYAPLAALLFAAVAGLSSGCRQSLAVPPAEEVARDAQWFEDVTDRSGLQFVHGVSPEAEKRFFMPQLTGSGAALFDFDGDGLLDVYLVQNYGPESKQTNKLFHQLPGGRFEDVSAGSGLDVAGYGEGVAVGDINNDGLPDVLLTEYGRVRLFLNEGGGKFRDITREAGLENPHWGTSAAFFDFDRDGWLDLVVVNYVNYDPSRECSHASHIRDFCGPQAFAGTATRLFRNRGDRRGRFEDVTLKSGLAQKPGPGLGVVCADFNGDHWPDILVANDNARNHLWINQRDGTFKEEAVVRGVAYNGMGKADANMGIALGDVDGDGLNDVLITHLPDELPVLWRQRPAGMFQDRTAASGLARPAWRGTGFGTVLADFDHGGALHLAMANGGVRLTDGASPPGTSFWGRYEERNQLFANDGTGRFRDVSPENEAFCGSKGVFRGLACGDLDNDGALDLLVTQVIGPARLYHNVARKRGHWLMIRAVDPARGGRDCYGAELTIKAGGRKWVRLINPASSYLCSNDPRAHVGLGPCDAVDSIDVVWPDGTKETFPGQGVDRLITLRKGGNLQ